MEGIFRYLEEHFADYEESGSPHLGEFAEAHPDLVQSDGCIWEFGDKDFKERPQIYLGLKGILYVELRARGAARELHSSWGTVVPNPAWRLVRALNTLKNGNEEVLIPAVSTGLSYWGSATHAPNEHIRLSDFAQGMRHIALIIQEFAAG